MGLWCGKPNAISLPWLWLLWIQAIKLVMTWGWFIGFTTLLGWDSNGSEWITMVIRERERETPWQMMMFLLQRCRVSSIYFFSCRIDIYIYYIILYICAFVCVNLCRYGRSVHVCVCILSTYLILLYGNDISICRGRARPPGPGGSMKYRFVYLNVVTVFQLSLTLLYIYIYIICRNTCNLCVNVCVFLHLQYISIWLNYNDLTALPHWNHA